MTTQTTEQATIAIPDLDLHVRRKADAKTVATALAVGALFDLALRSGVTGLGGALTIAAAALALVATGRAATPQARALAAAAALFGGFLAVRTSDWLVGPDVMAAALLLTMAASVGDGRSVFDLSIPHAALRAAAAAVHTAAAPAFLATAKPARRLPTAAVRGVALATPIVVVLAALLASADAVFASLFRIPSSPAELIGHLTIIGIGAWGMAGLLRTASATPPNAAPHAKRARSTEANVVLAGLVALFTAFTATQLVTAVGGARHVLEQQGLTYAEYARSGFFQLLAVAALTMATLLAIRAATDLSKATLVLAEIAVGLTIVIVGVALYRLDLYEQAFGLTMLRLYCQIAAVWIALAFVLLGAALAGLASHRQWFPGAATAAALAILACLNIANPEALVVKRNVARATAVRTVDTAYLGTLSDDAVPALHRAGILPPEACDEPRQKGWAAANWSRAKANGVRNRAAVCHP